MTASPGLLLLLSVGIFLGLFSPSLVSAYPSDGFGTSSSRLLIPRVGIDRSSKDNGFPEREAQYATRRPYKADFDLLRVSDPSQELEMPLLRSNDLEGGDNVDYFLALDPTLRSRRRKRQVTQPQVISQPSTNEYQHVSLCLPHFNTNPLCRQMFFGVPSTSNVNMMGPAHTSALAVPSSASAAIFIPSTFTHSSPSTVASGSGMPHPQYFGTLNRNDLAILNYYQQFAPPQSPLQQQVGVFQGPLPDQRQRPEIPNIHTKYPYPYPPTLGSDPNNQQQQQPGGGSEAVGPDGISDDGGVTTDYPAEVTTTLLPQESQEEQQDPVAPAANVPDSSSFFQQQRPPAIRPSEITTHNPPPPPPPPPSSQAQGPQQQQIQSLNQALKNQIREKEQLIQEKDEEIRQLRSQLEQANQQIVSYEQENAVYKEYKDQYARSEEANVKLRDRVQQLENTNQHLQEQYGQLQQVNAEHKQQINNLKDSQQQLMRQVEDYQNQMLPLSKEVQRHRKEIEEFLIRIRKLGEENETLQKQVKLYQLKVNYIQEQQNQQHAQNDAVAPTVKKQQRPQQQLPQTPSPVLVPHDDELDPELMRMDAEIAELQRNAEALAATIKNLPQPQGIISLSAVDSSDGTAPKKENEFPGEAVQVNPVQTQKQNAAAAEAGVPVPDNSVRAPSASRTMPTWEKPAGF